MVVELIAKNKNEKFEYMGRCKLIIDSLSKLLLVEPVNEEYKMISALFKWKFVAQNNIIFVFAENDFQNFALIFDDPKKCKLVYDILIKKGATSVSKEIIRQNVLPLLMNQISNDENSKIKEILFKWIELFNGKEKEELIQILKDNNIYDLFYPNESQRPNPKKRKRTYTINAGSAVCKKIVQKPNFDIFLYEHQRIVKKLLIIFLDSSRETCYEYYLSSKNCKLYYCRECANKKHFVKAYISQQADGSEFVMLKSSNHICEIKKFNPEKYGEKEIVEADNFKIFENVENGRNKSKLFIFASSNKLTCYKYFWSHNRFSCCGCNGKKKYNVTAELYQYENQSNYLKLSKKKHICKPIKYDPEKFDTSKKEIIESSNFKVFHFQHNGKPTSRLVVFCPTNKNLCYDYCWNLRAQFYHCSKCPLINQVTATLCQKEDFKDYLMLSNSQHICDLQEFDPEKYKDDVILDKSMYKISATTIKKLKYNSLIIFANPEKKFYHKFIYKNKFKHYYCTKCLSLKLLITAKIHNEGKENECVYVSSKKHICEPFEYFSSENGNIVMAPNFRVFEKRSMRKIIKKMAVFTNDEKSECFEYTWNQNTKYFICYTCTYQHKIHVCAKIFKNVENQECVELSENLHKCKPIKFVPENLTSKIVKAPGFKLYDIFCNKKSVKRLAIYDSKTPNKGYIYNYNQYNKNYQCFQCKKRGRYVIANLFQDENGENYIELNKNEHFCEMQYL